MTKQNWDISYDMHLDKYRKINPKEASERTCLEFDSGKSHFKLTCLGYELYAEYPEFRLTPADAQNCPKILCDFQMRILTMLVLTAGVSAPQTGAFKAYRELPWGELYDTNFNGRCIKRFAFGFGFKPEAFEKAAEKLGGKKLDSKSSSLGDIAFDFPFLGGITCRFILWTPDEEFPPSAQILFSDNSALMYNAEDLAAVGDVIISALKEMS